MTLMPRPVQPAGMKVLIAANFLAAAGFAIGSLIASGDRFIGCLVLAPLHALLGFGLWRGYRWGRIAMLLYAVFQGASLAVGSVVSILVLAGQPPTESTFESLGFAVVFIPFLAWAALYLARYPAKPAARSGAE